jgi:hypothetical protein
MTRREIIERVLAENLLEDTVEHFLSTDDEWTYCDRHVLDPVGLSAPDEQLVGAACEAALALGRAWNRDRARYASRDVRISRPYVIVDDDWLGRMENAPPPHVYIWLAREHAPMEQREGEPSTRRDRSGHPAIDALLTSDERLHRIEGPEEGEPGCWIIHLPDE